jgi:hypothetical protein
MTHASETFCTNLPLEARCDGCPLTERQADDTQVSLAPHQLHRIATETLGFLGRLELELSQGDYLDRQMQWIEELEPTYFRTVRVTGRDIANWRTLGACEHHEAPIVISDPAQQERLQQAFHNLVQPRGEQ